MTVRPLRRRLLPIVGMALATAVLASGCGGDDEPTSSDAGSHSASDPASDTASELDDLADAGEVPDECREAFPTAFVAADLADVALLPDGWPDPPVDAVLCSTSSTMDDSTSIAGYATTSSPSEVLDAYQDALAGTWEVTREDRGFGEVLSGTAGDVSFQVQTRDGAFDLTFAAA